MTLRWKWNTSKQRRRKEIRWAELGKWLKFLKDLSWYLVLKRYFTFLWHFFYAIVVGHATITWLFPITFWKQIVKSTKCTQILKIWIRDLFLSKIWKLKPLMCQNLDTKTTFFSYLSWTGEVSDNFGLAIYYLSLLTQRSPHPISNIINTNIYLVAELIILEFKFNSNYYSCSQNSNSNSIKSSLSRTFFYWASSYLRVDLIHLHL